MALINVGGVSRAMKAGGKRSPRSHHPDQPTVLERFILNNYARVAYVIEATSFRTDRIIRCARRFYRVIGFCEDVPGQAVMVQGHPDNIEIIVLVHYNCPKGHISRVVWRVRFGPIVLSEEAKRERAASAQPFKGKRTPPAMRWKVKEDRCTRCHLHEFVCATYHVKSGSTSDGENSRGMSLMYETLFTYKGFVAAGDANKFSPFHSTAHQELTERTYGYVMGDAKNGGVAVLIRAYIAGFKREYGLLCANQPQILEQLSSCQNHG